MTTDLDTTAPEEQKWRYVATAWVRAGLIHDVFSAHQSVEDDDMNVFCLGGRVIGPALTWELIETFLAAHFSGALRHRRRMAKVQTLENQTRENQEVGA